MKRFLRRPLGILGAAVIGAATVAVLPTPAHAATVTIVRTADWGAGHLAAVTVANLSPTPLNGWTVLFDLPPGTTIQSNFSAILTRPNGRYQFTNPPWAPTIAPMGRFEFGYVAMGSGSPQNCTVNGDPCTGAAPQPDTEPPTMPANLRGTSGSINAIWWDASTDNVGVVGYEVSLNGTVIARVTGTRYDLPAAPPPGARMYGIAAVDGAGNISRYASFPLGQVPDNQPPTAISNLAVPKVGANFRVNWTAATDDVAVAGYEVSLNGIVRREVGGTFAWLPYTGYGEYWVAVRSIDSAGRYGPRIQVGFAIDPPPPTP